jgi:hypothetical protein
VKTLSKIAVAASEIAPVSHLKFEVAKGRDGGWIGEYFPLYMGF